MLVLTMDTETTHKPLNIFKENIRESLKNTAPNIHRLWSLTWYHTNGNFLLLNYVNYVIHIIY